MRRQWEDSQGERPQDETNLADTLTLDSGLQNGEKVHFCGLSPPVCGIWLWQPEQTNTLPSAESWGWHHQRRAGTQKTPGKSQRQGPGTLKTSDPDEACVRRLALSVHQWIGLTEVQNGCEALKTASPMILTAAGVRSGRTDSTGSQLAKRSLVKLRGFVQSQRASTDQRRVKKATF